MTYYPKITAINLTKGYGYVTGGDTGVVSAVNEKYDDVANTWATKQALGTARKGVGGFSLNSYGYIAGGFTIDDSPIVEQYNDILNTWTVKDPLDIVHDGVSYTQGFSLNGYGYVVGGDGNVGAIKVNHKYDDVLNTWTQKASITTDTDSAATFSLSGYGYIAGGTSDVPTITDVTQKYDDVANIWNTKDTLSVARAALSGFSLDSYGYVVGGVDGPSNITEKYDDINNTWSTVDTLNTSKNRNAAFSTNGYGYSSGGFATAISAVHEKYDCVLNTWTAKTNMTTARQWVAGFSLGNITQSIQNPDIQEIIKANRRLRSNEAMVTKVASANARNTHNAETTTTSATYIVKKIITFNFGLKGGYRILFDIKTSDITKTAYGKVYKNSPGNTAVAIGTEQSEVGLVYATKSEDLTISLSPGDTLELWLHNDGVGTTSAQNFKIAYDDSPTVAVETVNS